MIGRIVSRIFWLALMGLMLSQAHSHANTPTEKMAERVQKLSETQIRNLVDPILDKYCHDSCKLLAIQTEVDVPLSAQSAPGFEETNPTQELELVPARAKIKLLIDDKVGPQSRSKILELLQQYLDTFDYPIKVDTQIVHFPLPQGSEARASALRERITHQFHSILHEIIQQFCPQTCLFTDFNLQTEWINGEESQSLSPGEMAQDGDTAIKIKEITGTLLLDQSLTPEEQANILEITKLRTNLFRHVTITPKSIKFPKANSPQREPQSEKSGKDEKSETNRNSNTTDANTKQEKLERFEKIERVENGDAVQAELKKFKLFGIIFVTAILGLLLLILITSLRKAAPAFSPSPSTLATPSVVQRLVQDLSSDPTAEATESPRGSDRPSRDDRLTGISKRFEMERILDELTSVYAQQPKVAKQVFSRILTEEGVETTSKYIHLFGESIIIEMLRDPSLQTDLTELLEYYAKNPIEILDDEKLDLLRRLHSRTVAGKLVILGNRSINLFDFLNEMDGLQIYELVRTESLTVKSIVMTQCDPQKRSMVYSQMEPEIRIKLLSELSRIDHLPRDFIYNVANSLKRKRHDNPKLNTEALPGSEVLVSLLERTGHDIQKSVVESLELSNPDSARTLKNKLVSIDTLRFLRDGQLLEVILSLKHEELIQFLKGAPKEIRQIIFSKAPKELVSELEEELTQMSVLSREIYHTVERKILNRMKIMATDGQINLIETNERMFSENSIDANYVQTSPSPGNSQETPPPPPNPNRNSGDNTTTMRKVSGW